MDIRVTRISIVKTVDILTMACQALIKDYLFTKKSANLR